MKKFSFIICALLFLGKDIATAQYVTIPDANFVNYLDTQIPSAMSGNQMDTTNIAVITLNRIDVENLGITDLTGVQYFKDLITLDCGNGNVSLYNLTGLPSLPNTLDTLICGYNHITSLPLMPSGLVYLACYGNQSLTNLPALPSTLTYLECFSDDLTSLPALPSALAYLDCSYNPLTNLPTLPSSLTTLDCSGNPLTNLPTLPSSLIYLICEVDGLTSLPVLPNTLTNLDCFDNQLTSLPTLPNTLLYLECGSALLTSLPALPSTLLVLECGYSSLTSLPTLPNTLEVLECEYDSLTSLPALPSTLGILECENNNISCFPVFPNTLTDTTYFNISANPFSCLPNYVPAMNPGTLVFPLCAPGNPSGCPSSVGIVGFTYKDMNSDCSRDSGDSNLVNVPIKIYDASNNLLGQTYSAINGVYDFQDTAATYKVVVDTSGGMPFVAQCTYPGLDSMVAVTSLDTNVNFSLTCPSGFDVGIQSALNCDGLVFPGMQHQLNVVAGDMSQRYNLNCANEDSGTVQITLSGPVTYIGPAAGALTPIVSGNVFTYHIANFSAIHNTTAFNLILRTNNSALAGDTICVSVNVTPLADNNPSNNTYQYCYYVINSHDPNNKEVYPVNVTPDYDGWFTYTIHFQNTGTAAAANIMLSDTLDNQLDLKTFQLLNYSNPNTTSLVGNILTVRFNNINLPDSTGNSAGSSGFIQYRIKPNADLPSGTLIKNTGYIYFDYNAAVVTNTTQNLFTGTTSVNTIVENEFCKVFPNPNNGTFTIALSGLNSQSSVEVYNMLGEKIFTQTLNNTAGNNTINLTNQSAGIYMYRIINQSGSLVGDGKLVIQK